MFTEIAPQNGASMHPRGHVKSDRHRSEKVFETLVGAGEANVHSGRVKASSHFLNNSSKGHGTLEARGALSGGLKGRLGGAFACCHKGRESVLRMRLGEFIAGLVAVSNALNESDLFQLSGGSESHVATRLIGITFAPVRRRSK